MISNEEIEHLKELARVRFGKKETEQLAKDLGDILGYVEKLKEVNVSSMPEMTHALEGVKNVMRRDGEPEVNPELAHDLSEVFPEKHDAGHGTYLKVKSIL